MLYLLLALRSSALDVSVLGSGAVMLGSPSSASIPNDALDADVDGKLCDRENEVTLHL